MKRLEAAFARRKVLVAYLCVGDPSVDESVELALACVRAGADVLELGVPFSDPTADGPAIARASQRALAAGSGLEAALRAAKAVRARDAQVGVVLFGYYNPIFVRGVDHVALQAADAGVDALLVVDLPLEESDPLRAAAHQAGVGVVPLLAPTSTPERIAAVGAVASRGGVPFVYYVSARGVTGRAGVDAAEAGARAAVLKAALGLHVVVGFGIDSRERARDAARGADGVVVGTALVKCIEDEPTFEGRRVAVEAFTRELRAGVDEAEPPSP